MKKAYALLASISLLIVFIFFISLSLQMSSYYPRQIKDLYLYIQANILATNAKELAKYFLYIAKKQNKECLERVEFNYPNAQSIIRIDYFYSVATCKNYSLAPINQDINLSKDNVINVNISIYLNKDKEVNEEIFINKKLILFPK
ncbi:hypothetical protein [Campylobacter sp. US33a]|uniref:hypothetical protein n=1 Tax=Campylobacter sp. US33a TaxID=2498120 RepID=UPI00106851BF|nr:hypothetical protein [Campylobacter sp. US33a]TEY03533.1 hypothetical protein ELQ16_02990 [Campylobacter sp. US33a]